MRAVVIDEPGGPDVLKVREVPDPVPAPGEVLVAVAAAGVNRADIAQREGFYAGRGFRRAAQVVDVHADTSYLMRLELPR